MHRPRLTQISRTVIRVTDAQPVRGFARDSVMLAIDDVADPPDGEAEQDARGCRVGAEPDRQVPADADEKAREHAANRTAPDRDAALPDEEDLQRVREVVLPAIDDGHDPRADDPAGDTPGGNGGRVVLRDARTDEAKWEPHSEQDADRGEDAVPRDAQRPE